MTEFCAYPSLVKGGLSRPVSRNETGLARKGGFNLSSDVSEPSLILPLQGRELRCAHRQRFETKSAITREKIVSAARGWLGTPYVHQASAKGAGCDCLGLIRGVYAELYGEEPEAPPPYTPDWNEKRGAEEPLLSAARRHLVEVEPHLVRPGQVLIFRIVKSGPAKHCGVATTNDAFIHAYAGRGVLEGWLARWWLERVAGVFEFPGVE